MNRLALAASAFLLSASPLPLLAQDAATAEVEAIDTGTGATMVPVPGWSSDMREGMMVFTAPEGSVFYQKILAALKRGWKVFPNILVR